MMSEQGGRGRRRPCAGIATALAAALLLAACDRGDRPMVQTAPSGPLTPMPPPPAWSGELSGRPFAQAFPDAAGRCLGSVDGVVGHVEGGVVVAGWAWDQDRRAAVERVVFVDAAGRMSGFAEGRQPRRDVADAVPEVASPDTGWIAHLPAPPPPATVYGLLGDGRACRLGVFPTT